MLNIRISTELTDDFFGFVLSGFLDSIFFHIAKFISKIIQQIETDFHSFFVDIVENFDPDFGEFFSETFEGSFFERFSADETEQPCGFKFSF